MSEVQRRLSSNVLHRWYLPLSDSQSDWGSLLQWHTHTPFEHQVALSMDSRGTCLENYGAQGQKFWHIFLQGQSSVHKWQDSSAPLVQSERLNKSYASNKHSWHWAQNQAWTLQRCSFHVPNSTTDHHGSGQSAIDSLMRRYSSLICDSTLWSLYAAFQCCGSRPSWRICLSYCSLEQV